MTNDYSVEADVVGDAIDATCEKLSNKSQSVSTDASSTTKYPSVKAVKDYVDGLVGGAIAYINQ